MPIQKILIVDDSKTETMFFTDVLQSAGFTVSSASTAAEALMQMQIERPDLLLLDIVMPGTNGFEFTRQLRRAPYYANLPIILCSTKSLDSDKWWGMRQGATGYITKPMVPEELLTKIRALE